MGGAKLISRRHNQHIASGCTFSQCNAPCSSQCNAPCSPAARCSTSDMRWCDGSICLTYFCNVGSSSESGGGNGWAEAAAGSERDAPPFNVLLAAYPVFERDSRVQKLDRALLEECRWSQMVLVCLCTPSRSYASKPVCMIPCKVAGVSQSVAGYCRSENPRGHASCMSACS